MKKLIIISSIMMTLMIAIGTTANATYYSGSYDWKALYCKYLDKKIDYLDAKFEKHCDVPPPVVCPCVGANATSGDPLSMPWNDRTIIVQGNPSEYCLRQDGPPTQVCSKGPDDECGLVVFRAGDAQEPPPQQCFAQNGLVGSVLLGNLQPLQITACQDILTDFNLDICVTD